MKKFILSILLVSLVLTSGCFAANLERQYVEQDCPSLRNTGEVVLHLELKDCHDRKQVVDVRDGQLGDFTNSTGKPIELLWKLERHSLEPGAVFEFVGPGRLQAPIR